MTEIIHRDLRYGGKSLALDINAEKATASIRFGTRRFGKLLRRPNETAQIYLIAEAIIAKWVLAHNQGLTLRFDTANTNLKVWARLHQEDLGFDVKPANRNSWRVTVVKRFFPPPASTAEAR